MLEPSEPLDEASRLATLRGLKILDTPTEERFDRLTRLAKHLLDVPIALVSLIDSDRQWFKSRQGLDASETPRSISFCGHAIHNDQIFIIPDTLHDPRFADNPLVTGAPYIRFYAGQPLRVLNGRRVGTLCVIDIKPRQLNHVQLDGLRDLGVLVENELNFMDYQHVAEALQESAARLNLALTASKSCMWDADLVAGRIVLDVHWSQMLGEELHETDISFEQLTQLVPDDEAPKIRHHMVATLKGEKKDYWVVHRVRHRLGHWIWIESRGQVIARDASGRALRMIGTNTDITERKKSEESLVRIGNLHRAIVEGAGHLIITTDTDGVIMAFNRAAEQSLGYRADELIGKFTPAVFHDPDEIVRRAQELTNAGQPVDPGFEVFVLGSRQQIMGDTHEWTYIRKDGIRFPVSLTVSALRDSNGEIYAFMGIATDITERVRNERMKSEFISTVSHELRTPLTSIRGSLGLIAGGVAGELPAQAKALVDVAQKNSERLILLVNDILDMEKIEGGKMEFRPKPTELLPLLTQALEGNRAYAQHFCVTYELESSLNSVILNIDANRMLQVLANLLSNAAKFSRAGGRVVVAATSDGRQVRIAVSDHGSGIPQQFRTRIFQKFAQADSSDTRMKGGTGLGLSITKAIVEQMGGSIGFDSQPNVLTTFFVDFPIWQERVAVESDAKILDKTKRVLVCEDDQDIATLLRLMLEQNGLLTHVARNAAQARQLLGLHDYAAMTLDLGLPDQNGISLIRELRTNKKTAYLPIIVVSANASKGRKELNGDAFTVIDWINKPIDHAHLVSALEQAIAQSASTRPRVLHVEDDADIYRVVHTIVGGIADTENAPTVAAARKLLRDRHFDLAILDVTLPDGSGMELLRELNSASPPVPVMVFSAHEITKEVAVQVQAFLVKSRTDNEQLLATIKRIVGLA